MTDHRDVTCRYTAPPETEKTVLSENGLDPKLLALVRAMAKADARRDMKENAALRQTGE